MKKAIIFLITCCMAFSGLFSLPASALLFNDDVKVRNKNGESVPYEIQTPRYYIKSLDTEEVIFSKGATEHCAPASLTKIATAIVALENCKDLTTVIEVPERCIRMLDGTGSSMAGLKVGEKLTMKDMLACLLIHSANEAATTIADYIGGGSYEKFIDMMNETAKRLGCNDTHFVNAHGLDEDGHYSCPKDIAILAEYALKFPVFKDLTSMSEYTLPQTNLQKPRKLQSTNLMMSPGYPEYYLEAVKGIKTGSTTNAGKCFVTTVVKDGYSYICAMMGAPFYDYDKDGYNENFAFMDTQKIFTWVFNNIKLRTVASASQAVTVCDVKYASGVDHVRLVPKQDYVALVPKNVDADSVLIEPVADTMPTALEAPLKKGDEVCDAVVKYAGQEVMRIRLVAGEDIDRSLFAFVFGKLGEFTHTTVFKVFLVIALLLAGGFFGLRIYAANHRRRRKIRVVNYRDVRKK
ncbi:MAG TPA: hypothetical protein DDY98_05965 [Ruminococcaceae bacterium]|nr:hypothetical protein [Oscillospiraceae bacterium]